MVDDLRHTTYKYQPGNSDTYLFDVDASQLNISWLVHMLARRRCSTSKFNLTNKLQLARYSPIHYK